MSVFIILHCFFMSFLAFPFLFKDTQNKDCARNTRHIVKKMVTKLIKPAINQMGFFLFRWYLLSVSVQLQKPVRKGSYPLRPGVQGFFITCDGGRESQASREAINLLDNVCSFFFAPFRLYFCLCMWVFVLSLKFQSFCVLFYLGLILMG